MGCQPGSAACGEWNQLKKKCAVINKSGRAEPPKPFDTRYGTTGFGVCPAGL